MSLADIENHVLFGKYPCRLPVWWGHYGEIGVHPNLPKISGKKVVLRIEKRFNKFERILAKLFKAPKEVRRPLDEKNSLLTGSLRMGQENLRIYVRFLILYLMKILVQSSIGLLQVLIY